MVKYPNLQEVAEMAFRTASGFILKGHEAVPTFICVMENGEMAVLVTPWETEDQKFQTFDAIREMFTEKNVHSYAFVSEAWVSTFENGGSWDGRTQPSKDPKRKEMLMVDANSRDGKHVNILAEITSKDDGTRTITEPNSESEHEISGRAVNFLKSERESYSTAH